jgi:hypothetical protein
MVVLAGQCLRSAPSGAPRVMSSTMSHVCWRGLHMFMACATIVSGACAYSPACLAFEIRRAVVVCAVVRGNAGMLSFLLFVAPAAAFIEQPRAQANASVAVLFKNGTVELDDAFRRVFGHFAQSFDYDLYNRFASDFEVGLDAYKQSAVVAQYAHGSVVPHCDLGVVPTSVAAVRGVAAFPGGVVGSIFGFDMGKRLFDLSGHARGPASAGLVAPMALSTQALSTGMGLVQAALAAMIHVVPPLVPPPAWNNQPLSCVPMASGHNCFGSVLYPITMADFMLADVTDSMLDGYVASFPALYAKKVGKTSDSMYKSCFSSYMGMMCSSVFPRCTTPQSRDEIIPVGGSVPVCLHMCVMPLVMCPGFWVNDLLDSCSSVSVPPLCSQAAFANVKRAPPQHASFDEANPFSATCPPALGGGARDEALELYDAASFPESPIEKEAATFAPVTSASF